MPPSYNPRLINGPFDDPGLFIPFFFERRALIFDLGDIYTLSPRDILKISHVFITHTHMDHFAGFDRLLRLFLGREKSLYLYGPEGFLKNVEGKLAGYSWNLVENFSNRFALHLNEVHQKHLISRICLCRNRFVSDGETVKPFNGILLQEPAMSISSIILDHGIPCLGFILNERFHINIIKSALSDLGLEIGPWLKEFKQALFDRKEPESEFEVKSGGKNSRGKKFILGDLAARIAIIKQGSKIAYITDVVNSKLNEEKIVEFVKDSDHLYIEAAFLEKHKDIAQKKYHLTARQAGSIAGRARVKQFTIFHFSPRHTGQEQLLQKEAMDAYEETLAAS